MLRLKLQGCLPVCMVVLSLAKTGLTPTTWRHYVQKCRKLISKCFCLYSHDFPWLSKSWVLIQTGQPDSLPHIWEQLHAAEEQFIPTISDLCFKVEKTGDTYQSSRVTNRVWMMTGDQMHNLQRTSIKHGKSYLVPFRSLGVYKQVSSQIQRDSLWWVKVKVLAILLSPHHLAGCFCT